MKSGNSKTLKLFEDNKKIFRKTFHINRKFNFYQELILIKYLHKFGIKFIPKLINYDLEKNYLFYEYIDSIEIPLYQKAALYEDTLKTIINKFITQNIPITFLAKESLIDTHKTYEEFNFRLKKHMDNNLPNIDYFNQIKKIHKALAFLKNDFLNLEHSSNLIFSHADAGIHNCIHGKKNKLYLVDFEYAGLDSPVKLHIDYLIHPRNVMYTDKSFKWTEFFYKYLISEEDLKNIHIYNSFFSLKWSLIVLNEYLSENWKYRINADPSRKFRDDIIRENQLKKSKLYLKACYRTYEKIKPQLLFTESERILLSKSY